ncbi:MAG: O-methyltransferase [Rikenellaceae bacterium]|nr:O-methyltransferase [Rikenellaceae bacterium]MDE7355435.1 O-methyltransferase [Rikenellaceae bacterium]
MQYNRNELDHYVRSHSTPESDILRELDRATHLQAVQPRMLSGHIQGKMMEMMVRMLRPQRVLEIGTFTGYSAIAMAQGLDDGAYIDTVDPDDELEPLSSSFVARAGLADKIRIHTGDALEVVPRLGACYDLVYMDGDKREYVDYYRMLMDGGHLHSGSFILADNTLWDGKVASAPEKRDDHTSALIRFNDMVVQDVRVEVVIVPLRDGLSMIRVK